MRSFYPEGLYKHAPEVKPILPGLLFERDGVIVAGHSGVGKSVLVQSLCYSLACGAPFLAWLKPVSQKKVAYIFTEGGLGYVKNRLQKVGVPSDCKNLLIVDFQESKLVEDYDYLIQEFNNARFKPDVIIIDSLYASFTGTLISDKDVGNYRQKLDALRNLYNATIIITHHFTKEQRNMMGDVVRKRADDVYGSSLWSAWPTTMFVLEKQAEKHNLRCGKDRDNVVDPKELELQMVETPLGFQCISGYDIT